MNITKLLCLKQFLVTLPILLNFCNAQAVETIINTDVFGYGKIQFIDDKTVIVGGAKIYDFPAWNLLMTFEESRFGVTSFAVSDDKKYLFADAGDGKAKLSNIENGEVVSIVHGHNKSMTALAISPNNQTLITSSSDSMIILWDMKTGRQLQKIDGIAYSLIVDSTGKKLIIGKNNGEIEIWDIYQNSKIHRLGRLSGRVINFKFLNNHNLFIAQSENQTKVWETDSYKELHNLTYPYTSQDAYYDKNNNSINVVVVDQNEILILNTKSTKPLFRFVGYPKRTSREFINTLIATISPDGRYLISHLISQWIENLTKIWSLENGLLLQTLKPDELVLKAYRGEVAFDSYNKRLFFPTSDNAIKVWDFKEGIITEVLEKHNGNINSLSITNDGKYLLTGGTSQAVKLWDLNSLKAVHTFNDYSEFTGKVSWNGKFAAMHNLDRLDVWELEQRKLIYNLELSETTSNIEEVHFSYDNQYLFIGMINSDGNKSVSQFDLEHFYIVRQFQIPKGGYYLGFNVSPDGKYIAANSNKILYLWNVQDGSLIHQVENENISSIAMSFSNDSRYLATWTWDMLIKIWDIKNFSLIKTLNPKIRSDISSFIFTPDNHYLIAGFTQGNIFKIWHTENWDLVATLFFFGEKESVIVTSDNYYMATKDSYQKLSFKAGKKIYPFEKFDLKYNRPDIVLKNLGYSDPEQIEAYRSAYQKRLARNNLSTIDAGLESAGPSLAIISKEESIISKERDISIKISVVDEQYPLDRLFVYVNGVPVKGQYGINLREYYAQKFDTTFQFSLSQGLNKIQVSALNTQGIESNKETFFKSYYKADLKPDLYLAVIGVSNYQDTLLNLNYAAKDAVDIANLLREDSTSYKKIYSSIITNEKVLKESILDLKRHLCKSNVDDTVILFFAGHGKIYQNNDYYFFTYDIDFKNAEKRGLSLEEIFSIIDDIPARNKILFMDTCDAGEVDPDTRNSTLGNKQITEYVSIRYPRGINLINKKQIEKNRKAYRLMQTMFNNLNRATGITVVSASGGGESAFEGNGYSNGVFTHCIIEGIKMRKADFNDDNLISVSEIAAFVQNEVPKLTDNEQQPYIRQRNLENSITLFKYPKTLVKKTFLVSPKTNLSEEQVANLIQKNNFFCISNSYTKYWANTNAKGFVNEFEEFFENDIVIDHASELMWFRSDFLIFSHKSLSDANLMIEEMNNLKYAGFTGWRIPTLEEAMSLMEPRVGAFQFIDPIFQPGQTWTTDKLNADTAWAVFYREGYCYPLSISGTTCGLLPVRSLMPGDIKK